MIPISDFGRDHWSLFGYIETRIVDHKGIPFKAHLRCNHNRHPQFAHSGGCASKYPTRLANGAVKEDHDDWDCLDDLEDTGLLENIGTGVNRIYRLTGKGREVANLLRTHKAAQKSFATFSFKG